MEEMKPYKSLEGTFALEGSAGRVAYTVKGSKVPANLAEVPDYVANLLRKVLLGVDDSEAENLKKQVVEQQATIDKLAADLKDAKRTRRGR